MENNRQLLRIPQAVDYLQGIITARTLRQWVWRRKIETVRIGNAVCIPVDVLDTLIARGTTPAIENGERS